jgi:outer membrane receptor protein involved in Fe transport
MSDHGDASSYRYRVLAGQNFADGRANITAVGEYSKSEGLLGGDRRVYSADRSFLAPATPGPFKTVLYAPTLVASITQSGVPIVDDVFNPLPGAPTNAFGVTDGAGHLLAFTPGNSNLAPYDPGTRTANPVFTIGGQGLSLAKVSNLLSPIERINIDTLGHFDVGARTNIFGEAWFSETHGRNLSAQPAYNSAFFGGAGDPGGNIRLSVNNPFLPAASRAQIAQALAAYGAATTPAGRADPNWTPDHFYLARANTDLQSGLATANQVLGRAVLGVEGKFDIGQHTYDWEISGNYGVTRNRSRQPQLIQQNFENALDAVVDPRTGQIVCAASLLPGGARPAPTSSVSPICAPLNIFGENSPSQAARDYITHVAVATSTLRQRDFTATINGGLFSLPGGEVKAALGFENRRESASFAPDDFYSQGLGTGAAINAISGSVRTNEVFGELLVPIFGAQQGIPVLHSVQLEGAARRVDNSVSGAATTWTAGLRWSPIADLQFRGNKTRSIRAPAVTELFLPTSQSFAFANDPCDQNYINQGTAPATRAANCAAAGIAQPFSSNIVNATSKISVAGNQGLVAETANSKTFGFIYRPSWISHLNLAVDYIDIDLENAIESLLTVDILDACYDATDYPNNESCARITRDANGQVTFVRTGYVNAGKRAFQGITAQVDYTFDVPTFGREAGSLGSIQLRANYLDTRKLVSQVGSASPNNLVGTLQSNGVVKSRGTIDLNYANGPFGWYWQGEFVGSARFDNNDKANSKDVLGVGPWWVINSTVSYEFPHDIDVRLIVDNVFDKEPPFPALAGSGGNFANATSIYFSGIVGRTYLLSVDVKL